MEHADTVASLGFFHVMCGQDDRDALIVAQMRKVMHKLTARGGVEARARLIQHEQFGLVQQGFRQLNPALQSTRERFYKVVRACRQFQLLEHGSGPLIEPPAADTVEPPMTRNIFGDGQLAIDARMLKDDPKAMA